MGRTGEHAGKQRLQTATSGDSKEMRCFNISAYASNSMKSSNPHSGIQEVTTARTLDLNGGCPACNQGGVLVLAVIEGNGCRPSHKGPGISTNGNEMYTLNSTEIHGVVTRRNNELPKPF
jgi:DNA (cytosine-5)-methyltransferase 1